MAPKKKENTVVDSRSPIDIETEQITEHLKTLENQILTCKDGISDLAHNVTRIRQLELELAPKEAEHKNILGAFQRLCESVSSLKKIYLQNEDPASPTAASVRGGTGGAASMGGDNGSVSRKNTLATPQGNDGGQNSSTPAGIQDAVSKEALRSLAALTKNAVTAILMSVFDTPQTSAEKRAVIEQQEAAAAAAEAAAAPVNPPTTPPQGSRKGTIVGPEKAEKVVDPDLTCPVGIDLAVFNEVLRLRQHRMGIETLMTTIQEHLTHAHGIVEKRRDEGASKLLLKKLEKQHEEARRRLAELGRMKQEEELLCRSQMALNGSLPPRDRGSAGKTRTAK